MPKVKVSRRARADLKAALSFYHDKDPQVSRRFLQAMNACVARIVDAPLRWPLQSHGARRLLIPKFPYGIYYFDEGDLIVIIGIVHSRRHPEAWRTGMEEGRDD